MSSLTPEHPGATGSLAPPFPTALTISGNAWHSPLVASGPVPLIHPETYIGILDSNDIVLHDPVASRIHAVIHWTTDGYTLQDLGSRSGTLVDGKPVDQQVVLTPGARVRIGGTDLLFQAVRIQQQGELEANSTLVASSGPAQQIPGKTPIETAMEAAMSLESITSAIHNAQESSYGRWLSQQLPRRYWRVFVIGLVAYLAASRVLASTANTNLLPLVALLGSALVPVTFVVFCWEQRAFADFPPTVVGLAFVVGATVGLLTAAILEPKFVIGAGFGAALIIALIEETAKAGAALWFLGDNRRYREFDGLVLGAAVGMGFAALETAGYGFSYFLYGFVSAAQDPNATYSVVLQAGIKEMVHVLDVRMLLAAFGHGVWTAIICATIWRERRESTGPRIMSSLVPAYAISVLLGNLWSATPGGAALGRAVDRSLANLRITSSVIVAYVGVVLLHAMWDVSNSYALYMLYGLIGLFVLRFLIDEALERARLGLDAPPPPPLLLALLVYLVHVFRRIRRPVVEAIAFATAAEGGFTAAITRVSTGATGGLTIDASGTHTPDDAGAFGAEAVEPIPARYCVRCGRQLPEDAQFCPACGTEAHG